MSSPRGIFLAMGGYTHTYVMPDEADKLVRAGLAKWFGPDRMAVVEGADDLAVWHMLDGEEVDGEFV